jgi:hypothetical protein
MEVFAPSPSYDGLSARRVRPDGQLRQRALSCLGRFPAKSEFIAFSEEAMAILASLTPAP